MPSLKELEQYAFNKDVVVLIPLLASIAGITFDVGYFYGVGISYFTVFALSEHLVFALEALPLALVFVLLVVVMLGTMDATRIKGYVDRLNEQAFPSGQLKEKPGPIKLDKITFRNIVHWVLMFASTALFFYTRQWAIAVLASFALVAFVVGDLCMWVLMSRRVFFSYVSVGVLATSFVAGWQWADLALNSKDEPNTVLLNEKASPSGEIKGRVLRSGDRGVLVYSPDSSELRLIQWDEIRQIVKSRN